MFIDIYMLQHDSAIATKKFFCFCFLFVTGLTFYYVIIKHYISIVVKL